ncbi:MAG: UTP--glucose-1-phosphate uridylyltransferase, partial [Pseudomonadota bacterium]
MSTAEAEFGDRFWGLWMLGGMSGGGMGFLFDPATKTAAQKRLQFIMSDTKRRLEKAVPFAMEPVVYDFAINEHGTFADVFTGDEALMPPGYYVQTVPGLLRLEPRQMGAFRRAELDRFSEACRTDPELAGMVQTLFDRLLPSAGEELGEQQSLEELLEQHGFDRLQHEQIRADMRSGRIGLAQNRLPVNSQIDDVEPGEVFDATTGAQASFHDLGMDALASGAVAVVSLAGGTGSRWTKGAGVVKALNPFCGLGGRQRSFIEVHLAKSRRISRLCGADLPHVITTSYMTHEPIQAYLKREENYGYPGPLILSPGRFVGLRLVPMTRDLRFTWEEMPQQ